MRSAGVLAPNSPYRKEITLEPEIKKAFQFRDDADAERPFRNYAWSKMLAKVFKIDVTTSDHCGGKMRDVCAVRDPDSIARYLKSEQIDHIPPARGPPRVEWREGGFVDENPNADPCSDE